MLLPLLLLWYTLISKVEELQESANWIKYTESLDQYFFVKWNYRQWKEVGRLAQLLWTMSYKLIRNLDALAKILQGLVSALHDENENRNWTWEITERRNLTSSVFRMGSANFSHHETSSIQHVLITRLLSIAFPIWIIIKHDLHVKKHIMMEGD